MTKLESKLRGYKLALLYIHSEPQRSKLLLQIHSVERALINPPKVKKVVKR